MKTYAFYTVVAINITESKGEYITMEGGSIDAGSVTNDRVSGYADKP
jgi:hypothetical protein